MAETYQAGPATGTAPGRALARWTNYTGAAMSLALLIGVGVWGTKLVLRDVTGVPVVLAAEGPMRMAPEDPGGRPADHLGLSVNAVAGLGIAERPADTLRLAPDAMGLSDEDVALATFDEEPAAEEEAPRRIAAMAPLPTLSELTAEERDPATALQALADRLAAAAQPLEANGVPVAAVDSVPAEGALVAEPAVVLASIPRTVPGVAVSLRPSVRPAGLYRVAAVAAVAPSPAPAAPEGPREIAAAELPDGTRLVQLGAYDSADTARREWGRLSGRFGDYMTGKARVIEKASSGGKVFYRLRAHGFDDVSDARRFCAAFVAEGADCIPVVTR